MKILKSEKGSITLFVLLAMLFFVMYLVGMYMISANSESSVIEESARIKEIYEQGVNNIDDVYNTLERKNIEEVNIPKLAAGMTPVKWNETELIKTNKYDKDWYTYKDTSIEKQENISKWANAETEDGSLWVWIPRFAYKITYNNPSDKSQGGIIDVVFLKEDTNKDFKGNDVTDKNYIDEKREKGEYIVHPAFQDGSKNGFANGEWNKEITGFWMAKFEAGYVGNANEPSSAQDSNIMLTINNQLMDYYGTRNIGKPIKYPVFKGNRPSMNYLEAGNAFDLCRDLTTDKNPYGLNSNTDSHLTKSSEWGAVAYLTYSKYGRNGKKITINNVSVNGENTIYAVTGYGAQEVNQAEDTSRNLKTLITQNQQGDWTTTQGQFASTTGNIYGIYDLSGGSWEWMAGCLQEEGDYEEYKGGLKGPSDQYKSKYAGKVTNTGELNYLAEPNDKRVGEAMWETSEANNKSWETGWSFLGQTRQFLLRGNSYRSESLAGLFSFGGQNVGYTATVSFRPILITQ